MLLKDIKNYMQTKIECPYWSIGMIDVAKEKSIAILGSSHDALPIAMGGTHNSTYKRKTVEIIIRWNNEDEAEVKAQQIYDMFAQQPKILNGTELVSCIVRNDTPVNIESLLQEAIEFRLELTITYKEKEN